MSVPLLNRFTLTVYQDNTSADNRQIPASGSTLSSFRQGATLSATANFNGGAGTTGTVSVYDIGRTAVGDTLYVNGNSSYIFTVANILSSTSLSITKQVAATVVFALGDRLTNATAITLYADPTGTVQAGAGGVVTANSRGQFSFYVRETYFDYQISGTGLTTQWAYDAQGGVLDNYFNAADYTSIQDAIDALPSTGGTVFIPAGTYNVTDTIYTPCDRVCHLVGEGRRTIISNTTNSVDILRVRGNTSTVRSLTLVGPGNGFSGTQEAGRGLVVGRRSITDPHPAPGVASATEYVIGGSTVMSNVLIEDVFIQATASWCLAIPGDGLLSDDVTTETGRVSSQTITVWGTFNRVYCADPDKFGTCFIGAKNTTLHFNDCIFLRAGKGKAAANAYYLWSGDHTNGGASGVRFSRCTFEGYAGGTASWVSVITQGWSWRDCWFEDDSGGGSDNNNVAPWFIELRHASYNAMIDNPLFYRGNANANAAVSGRPRLIKLSPTGANGVKHVVIVNPLAYTVTNPGVRGGWIESNHIDMGSATNSVECHVFNTGNLIYTGSGAQGEIQYTNFPNEGMLIGDQRIRLYRLTNTQETAIDTPLAGDHFFNTSIAKGRVYQGGAWATYS